MDTPGDLVRAADRDRYVSALYSPEDRRGDLMALYAFNVELARIRDGISEPMTGEIRLRWWHDTLSAVAGAGSTGHPVADALTRAIRRQGLPARALLNMIEARRFDLYSEPMPSTNDLEGYCGETAGALIQLASLVLDPEAATDHGETAGHAGCAQAIAGLLALLPRHRSRGQCYIPADMLLATGATSEDLHAERPGEAAVRAASAMIALAREHLSAFERNAPKLPPTLHPAYLPLSMTRSWLDALERAGADVFSYPVRPSPIRRNLSMLHRAIRGWR